MSLSLIDTHTHFDVPLYDADWQVQSERADRAGVQHLVLVGYVAQHFKRMQKRQHQIQGLANIDLTAHIAYGLHPAYIHKHVDADLEYLAKTLSANPAIAVGEIGLDTFTDALKADDAFAKQKRFFNAQLDLAVEHELPVMLHIRKAHADALKILKSHAYDAHNLGGIAHSFSGGEQEADAFVRLGFKLGVTGQITNPNAKKLRRAITFAVQKHGLDCLVIETDCPDMTPVPCQTNSNQPDRNVPANLPYVLEGLSELLTVDKVKLAETLWQNSNEALQVNWNKYDDGL